jgi:hypothetical protein
VKRTGRAQSAVGTPPSLVHRLHLSQPAMSFKDSFAARVLLQPTYSKHLLFRCSILIGVLLSVLLVVETVATYRYVERDLVREEAQRESDRYVRSIVRAARLMNTGRSSGLGSLLSELAQENPRQIA